MLKVMAMNKQRPVLCAAFTIVLLLGFAACGSESQDYFYSVDVYNVCITCTLCALSKLCELISILTTR